MSIEFSIFLYSSIQRFDQQAVVCREISRFEVVASLDVYKRQGSQSRPTEAQPAPLSRVVQQQPYRRRV